jgi:hypothetical protein
MTGSLFSWVVGLFLTFGLLAVVRYASQETAHFFLSFLAVQCSLNSLQSLRILFSLSVEGSCIRTDAGTMAAITGLPAWFWAALWCVQAIVILGAALWLYQRKTP